MTPIVETATPNDADAIASILSAWIDETDWMPRIHTHEQDRGFGRRLIEVCDVSVVRTDTYVVGFLARQEDDIQAFYVHRDWRGKGVGKALLHHEQQAHKRLVLWTFQANSGARRFYERHGFASFEFTDGTGNDEKLPDVQMVWEGHER